MSRLSRLLLAAALVAAVWARSPSEAAPQTSIPEDWSIEHGQAVYTSDDIDHLRVEQLVGDIRVRGVDADRIVVTFAAQRHRDDPRAIDIQTFVEDGIRTLVPRFTMLEIEDVEAWLPRRIDIGIDIPRGLALTITTDSGLIDVSKLEAPARLISSTGEIRFDGSGALEAKSTRGRVRALLRSTAEALPFSIETLTGDITTWLLVGADAEVEIDTHGTVATDYSIEIERIPGRRHKRARATVGSGRRSLELRSHEGDVSLLALGADEGAEGD